MDLKNLFKKKPKEVHEPLSYDSLDSEFPSSEENRITSDYEITNGNDNSIELNSSTISEEEKDDFNMDSFSGNTKPFENLIKKTEESKSENNFSSQISHVSTVPQPDKFYTTSMDDISKDSSLDEITLEPLDDTNNLNTVSQHVSTRGSENSRDISMEIKQKSLPILGSLPIKIQYQIVGAMTVIGLIGLISTGLLYTNSNAKQSKALEALSSLQTNTQKLDNSFAGTTLGRIGEYEKLQALFANTKERYNALREVNENVGGKYKSEFEPIIQSDLDKFKDNIEIINYNAEFLKDTNNKVDKISKDVYELSEIIDRLGIQYVQLGAHETEMADIYALKSNLQIISQSTTQVLLSDYNSPVTVPNLTKARKNIRLILAELYNGNDKKGVRPVINGIPFTTYKDMANKWMKFSDDIDVIIARSPDLFRIHNLSAENSKLLQILDKHLSEEKNAILADDFNGINIIKLLLIISLIVVLFAISLLAILYTYERDNRGLLDKLQSAKTDDSIFRLINEMSPLQEGDLTNKLTVTEELTGNIADSINATVDSLSTLVKKIKDTSINMRKKTNEVNVISLEMLKSNEDQASSIGDTGKDVLQITQSITEITTKTIKGAEVAQNSVNVSEEGSMQVLASLNSMKEINQNMIETVHLMKIVSDSSKQISDIVGVLSDIAEDTAILALNATVQAARAGDAGKGFKIVADEIQELADSSGEKARTVGALIAAVQTSIQAVENAVNKTTQEVIKGVDLSEKAGESLHQITEVSYDLAELVKSISNDAKSYSEISKKVSNNMKDILEKTEQNKKSTQKTASSISEISELSNELGVSVQSFKV